MHVLIVLLTPFKYTRKVVSMELLRFALNELEVYCCACSNLDVICLHAYRMANGKEVTHVAANSLYTRGLWFCTSQHTVCGYKHEPIEKANSVLGKEAESVSLRRRRRRRSSSRSNTGGLKS